MAQNQDASPELLLWLRSARRLVVVDEGEQDQLFTPEPVRMYRLYNSAGESLLITEETARNYGLRPTPPRPHTKPQDSEELFNTQEGLFQ